MKNWIKGAFVIAAMTAAAPSMAATTINTINLSATNVAASSATQNFAAGNYTVSLISGVYSAWAPATPAAGNWTDYYAYSVNGGATQFFNPLNSQRFATAAAAFNAYSSAPQLTFSFNVPTSVTFAIADGADSFGDNSGGVSLAIAAVPEPATWLMMIVGFFAVALALRGARRSRGEMAVA